MNYDDIGDVYVTDAGARYKLGTLRVFRHFRDFVTSDDDWKEKYADDTAKVWTRTSDKGAPGAGLYIVKVLATFPNVDPNLLYDALHDPEFRKSWDDKMIEGFNLTQLDTRNDIGYYSAKFPFPLSNRDFLNQRFWMEFDNGEYIIMNRSVQHSQCPEKKDFVRGISLITGYYIKPRAEGGTELRYITHSDIRGSIPHMVLNAGTQKMAPGAMQRLAQNGENYVEWSKQNHGPNFTKSWRTPKVNWDTGRPVATVTKVASLPPVSLTDAEQKDIDKRKRKAEAERASSPLPGLKERLVELRAKAGQAQAGNDASLHLTELAPAKSDDPDAVQRYFFLVHAAADEVDKEAEAKGVVPSLVEYITATKAKYAQLVEHGLA